MNMKRMPVPLDEEKIIKLRGLLEKRLQVRFTVAAIVRMALDQLLETEAELSE